MGGPGSGRPRSYAPTVERAPALSIGQLSKFGLLKPGLVAAVALADGGFVRLRADADYIVLAYRVRADVGGWHDAELRAGIDRVRLRFGLRPFFVCPGCWRRCTSLILGARLLCRICRGLKHASTRERAEDRLHRRANKVRLRLGWDFGLANPRGSRPHGMHQRTFERLVERHDRAAREADEDLLRAVEQLTGRRLVLRP